MSATGSDPAPSRAPRIFLIIITAFLLWAAAWIVSYEPEHDEVEHWHAAWLMYEGKAPFSGFFEHHEPLLWNIIRIYYQICGENYGVIIATRLLILAVFLLTVRLTYKIARNWASPEGSWIAALGFPLFSLSLLHAHLFVRGDPIILLFLMIALNFAIGILKAEKWGRSEINRLVLIFICSGIALGFSPRAGIPVLTLFAGLYFLGRGAMPLVRRTVLFFIGGIIVLIPILWQAWLYNPDYYLFWVFKFSASLYPSFSPLRYLNRLFLAAFPLWILVLILLLHFFLQRKLRAPKALWLVILLAVVNFCGLWANSRPYMQHFLMTIPFFGLLAGLGYDVLINNWLKKWRLSKLNWAGILLLVGLLLTGYKSYRLWSGGGLETRSFWVQRASWLREHGGANATFAAGTAYFHPIFMNDALYYWFAGRYAAPTLDHLGRECKRYTPQALRVTRPTIIHESVAEAWGFKYNSQYRAWLKNHYDPTPYQKYWIRKDVQTVSPSSR